MIANILANGPTYFVIFVASLFVAACFVFNILRGLRGGRLYTYWGHVLRERHPAGFWLFVTLDAIIVVTLAATPLYIVWKHSSGN